MVQGYQQHAARAELTDHLELHGGKATIESVLKFTDEESRQLFRAAHGSGTSIELVVTGPVCSDFIRFEDADPAYQIPNPFALTGPSFILQVQDGFWVRATVLLAHLAWVQKPSFGLNFSSVRVSYTSAEDTYLSHLADSDHHGDGFTQYFEPLPHHPPTLPSQRFGVQLGCRASRLAWLEFGMYPNEWSSAYMQRLLRSRAVATLPLKPRHRFVAAAHKFWEEHGVAEDANVLGLHLRGTDKKRCTVRFERFLPLIRAYLCHAPGAVIFVATEDKMQLEEAQRVLRKLPKGARFLFREAATRTKGELNAGVHATVLLNSVRQRNTSLDVTRYVNAFAPEHLGADVMIDTLLLSRSNFLIGVQSAVTEYALYFNPRLLNHSFTFGISKHPWPVELSWGGVDASTASWDQCSKSTQATVPCGPAHAQLCRPEVFRPSQRKDIFRRGTHSAAAETALSLENLPTDGCAPLPAALGDDVEPILRTRTLMGHKADCESVRMVHLHEFGFMSMIHVLMDDVATALGMGWTPAIDKPRKWATPSGCNGIFCWLATFGGTFDGTSGCEKDVKAHLRPHLRLNASDEAGVEPSRASVLGRAAALATRLLRPNRIIAQQLASERLRLSLEGRRYIGVHIRSGDACSKYQELKKKRTCDSLHVFIPNITAMAKAYGIVDVFLASDGGANIFNATRAYPQFSWHFREADATSLDIDKEHFQRNSTFPFQVAAHALIDTILLSEAAALIGKMTSNIFRASFELAVGRQQCVPPYISLDAPWCFTSGGEAPILRGRFAGRSFQC